MSRVSKFAKELGNYAIDYGRKQISSRNCGTAN